MFDLSESKNVIFYRTEGVFYKKSGDFDKDEDASVNGLLSPNKPTHQAPTHAFVAFYFFLRPCIFYNKKGSGYRLLKAKQAVAKPFSLNQKMR